MKIKRQAFTLVELLTVVSIVIVLIGLLMPALRQVKKFARKVKQKTQFKSIDAALTSYENDWGSYPDSGKLDKKNELYCGAMKLCEALVGQDDLGFHPDSRFNSDCLDSSGNLPRLYDYDPTITSDDPSEGNKKVRRDYQYLQSPVRPARPGEPEACYPNAYRISRIYGEGNTGSFEQHRMVLCDEYPRTRLTPLQSLPDDPFGERKVGMPILYYKANVLKGSHDVIDPDNGDNTYDYEDNDDLVRLGIPNSVKHPMDSSTTEGGHKGSSLFYANTRNPNIHILGGRPFRPNSYILISAGYDGEYGTRDDIFNFSGKTINIQELDDYISQLPN